MENNEFKNLWKTAVDQDVKPYSEAELDAMVVKRARESMRKLYSGWKVKSVVCILIIGYTLWEIICNAGSPLFITFNTLVLLLIATGLILQYLGKRTMNKYKPDIPIKEWIKFRIDAIDKSTRIRKKYRMHINAGVIILIVGINAAYSYILNGSIFNYSLLIAFVASLLVLVFIRTRWKNRYGEVRDYLQTLYEQMDEQNPTL